MALKHGLYEVIKEIFRRFFDNFTDIHVFSAYNQWS